MSPASQGALEVDRYIGSCLITTGRPGLQKPLIGCRKQEQQVAGLKTTKQQCQSQFGAVGTWAGGAPLISMASNPRRNNNNQRSSPGQQPSQLNQQQMGEQHRVPLSRLAVHTQGAPLILSSARFPNNRAKVHNGQAAGCLVNGPVNISNISNMNATMNGARCNPPLRLNKPMVTDARKQQQAVKADGAKDSTASTAPGVNVANIDSLSIASDESSGSNNSENSLPRIIKPRKRRKKDRKPPMVNPANPPSTTDSKVIADEPQQTPLVVSPSSLIPNGVSELQQQQLKQFSGNSFEAANYPGDGYFKGHRRQMNNNNINSNNNNARGSIYGRIHLGSNGNASPAQEVATDTRQQRNSLGYAAHRHVQVKVLDDNRNVILPIPVCQAKAATGYLRHNNAALYDYNEPVTLTCDEAGSNNMDDCLSGSICQCHYCDPATLVWDVGEQNTYAPQFLPASDFGEVHHHHHHHHRFSQVPTTVFLTTARSYICPEHANAIKFLDVTDNPCLKVRSTAAQTSERNDGAVILRRSWSDPTSYFSDEIVAPNRDVGVIGDRGLSGDSMKDKSFWRGDASTVPSSLPVSQQSLPNGAGSLSLQGPLEVSTEIVTSPNGHRDLEIKFYSSSPTSYSANPEESKSAFAFPEEDANESEEFSDIWSYHEWKLQQDFRTLLQAEE